MVLRLSYQQGVVAHHVSSTNMFILNNRAHAYFIISIYSACFIQHFLSSIIMKIFMIYIKIIILCWICIHY